MRTKPTALGVIEASSNAKTRDACRTVGFAMGKTTVGIIRMKSWVTATPAHVLAAKGICRAMGSTVCRESAYRCTWCAMGKGTALTVLTKEGAAVNPTYF